MFAPHIFCLPFARIYINRAPSRWLSFPCPPSPHLLFHWGCHGCQLSIVFAHRQRICRDVQLAALEIGLERAWWISRNFKDANFCREALTWRCFEHSTQCHKKKVKQCRRAWKQLKESSLNQLGNSLINLSIIKVAAINCNWKLFYFHSWLKFKLWHFIWCQFDASVLESSIVSSFFFLETRKIYIFTIYRYLLLKFFIFLAPFILLIYLPSSTNIKIISNLFALSLRVCVCVWSTKLVYGLCQHGWKKFGEKTICSSHKLLFTLITSHKSNNAQKKKHIEKKKMKK